MLQMFAFILPTAPHPPSIRHITAVEKTALKTRGIQIACRISYEMLAI